MKSRHFSETLRADFCGGARGSIFTFLFAAAIEFSAPAAQASVLWMEQAQRLQEVSATLLDTMPVPVPLSPSLAAGLRANISFLPAPNPRVGAKLESLPASPVQSIPSLHGMFGVSASSAESLAVEAWAGVLPKGVEKLMGIKASLMQLQWGGRAEVASQRLGFVRFVLGVGAAQTKSTLEGTISSASGTDSFTSSSQLTFANLTAQHPRSGIWGAFMIGRKKTTSRLVIVEDDTDLEVVDTLANTKQPNWIQVSLGLPLNGGLSLAISELVVPDRVEMPRLTLAWNFLSPSGAPRE
ncbi:MAG: hypothetical protein RI953_2418 [Pseudomonadota bacterium]